MECALNKALFDLFARIIAKSINEQYYSSHDFHLILYLFINS